MNKLELEILRKQLLQYTAGCIVSYDKSGFDKYNSKIESPFFDIDYTKSKLEINIPKKQQQKIVIFNQGSNLDLSFCLNSAAFLKVFLFQIESQNNSVLFNLLGEKSELEFCSFVYAEKEDFIQNNFNIIHSTSNTKSASVLKNISSQQSKLNIEAQIVINSGDLQNVDADLKIKTLKLSKESKVMSRPNLKILSRGVRCTHSNTITNLSESELFYLMSRGLGKTEAIKILTQGFAKEVFNKVKN